MERDSVDYSLYYVTGRLQLKPGQDFYENLEAACAGGVTIVQLREKNISTREFVELATRSKAITDKYNVPLLINDRLDIALAVPGCGLHVGQSDLPATLVRKLLGDKAIIGVSTNEASDIHAVIEEGVADYIGIGPVHFTASKDVLSPILGPRGISRMLTVLGHSKVKAVAIGGVSQKTIDNLMRQSPGLLDDGSYRELDGVAIVSALAASVTPKETAIELLDLFNKGPGRLAFQQHIATASQFTQGSVLGAVGSIINLLKARPSALIHHITNNVVQNDTANLTLCFGCSPIMSGSAQEAEELGRKISTLLINFGTINTDQIAVMVVAGQTAVRNSKPVLFDPVGIGATDFRLQGAEKMLNSVHMSVIKGNAGEIAALVGSQEVQVQARGVDSVGGFTNPAEVVRLLAAREKLVVAMSGEKDYVSNGVTTVVIENGNMLQDWITGSGCMASTAIAACLAVAKGDSFIAAIAGMIAFNVAAELAAARPDVRGPSTFRAALLDEVYNLTEAKVQQHARFSIVTQ